jgi:hypothetical protein
LSICHLLGVAGFAATADNLYFVMAGFAAITDYFCCRGRLQLRDNRIVAVPDCVALYHRWLV